MPSEDRRVVDVRLGEDLDVVDGVGGRSCEPATKRMQRAGHRLLRPSFVLWAHHEQIGPGDAGVDRAAALPGGGDPDEGDPVAGMGGGQQHVDRLAVLVP